jgi:hypothetical protein
VLVLVLVLVLLLVLVLVSRPSLPHGEVTCLVMTQWRYPVAGEGLVGGIKKKGAS